MKDDIILYIVVPCYNEQAVLPETERRLSEKLHQMAGAGLVSEKSRIVFVDDGSTDGTWELIEELYEREPYVTGIKSSKNRGHQNALLEGLLTVAEDCDAVISMDADLQDDIEVLEEFIHKYRAGAEIVYGVRSDRKKDTRFKRRTAEGFYKLMAAMGVNIVYNHADYRLMSRRAIQALGEFREVNLFLRGIVPMIGFPTDVVEYERKERFAGESKYPVRKMLSFALDGITSFSIKPIRMITALGFLIFFVSLCMLLYFLIGYFSGAELVRGWTTLIVSIWAIGGLELLAIGIVGEYIGKIYLEAKARPRFIVEKYLKK